ncbi:hypothetical protein [Saccharolobus islandicus]|uniref:Conserved conjugative plasmid protein n=1 Tax=Saccharolobus islandicus (strain L.D.8.5 / Lassen \|nr:hypothetical protein [Sulfolobus islandicus]ADB87241.1 conserved conjugative plasmid protein [Sulfolobus islandicus L.D.8.5]
MPEECTIIQSREGYLIDSCTGEVLDFVAYDNVDYSSLEYYERVSSQKREEKKEVRDMKKIVLNYLLSVMSDEEKDKFYRILNEVEKYRRPDAATYLAIYEYILSKENKTVDRNYIKFLEVKGVGRYAIRQKKKLLRKMFKEDPVLEYINNEYSGNKEEALKIYEILKKKNLIYGRAETRKRILLEYLNDSRKKKLLEEYYVENLIRWNFNNIITFQLI